MHVNLLKVFLNKVQLNIFLIFYHHHRHYWENLTNLAVRKLIYPLSDRLKMTSAANLNVLYKGKLNADTETVSKTLTKVVIHEGSNSKLQKKKYVKENE